ncbi:TPA: EamA family transporter [candidate division WWE3 bacterium]|uniref:Permease, drug/metabolite transporter superfamily n=3 Tax=Katanobacteria TaxID=422282 RepID=A0A0G1KGV8_UNCKA|nr:MAG: Permease, drug/metabolite transporter superfamily [candidate division WWE3 bacterium GW2011_GWB1_44_4]KKT83001.1 MAG: Permease, drug/metabolite transporter superfamily [candidate division WWE3 bacterium GW2011_GWC2_44_9]HAZ29583.1 EamA family transporter [candidate division WWE3 bacterium]
MQTGWLIYALLSAFFASLVAVFGKIGLKDIDSNTATAIRAVVMAVFLIGLVLVQGKYLQVKQIISQPIPMLFVVLSGLAGAASWLFYFLALKNGKASQIVPIDRLSVIFTLILAFLILGEKLSLKAALGAVIIVIGAVLVALG